MNILYTHPLHTCMHIFPREIPSSGIAELKGMCILNFNGIIIMSVHVCFQPCFGKVLSFPPVVDKKKVSPCCFWILHVDPVISFHPSLPR